MPDTEMLKWMLNLGPGLAIAMIILFWARSDRKVADDRYAADRKAMDERYSEDRKAAEERYTVDRRSSEDRLASLAKDWREVVENNTRALTTMEVMLQRGIASCPYVPGAKHSLLPFASKA